MGLSVPGRTGRNVDAPLATAGVIKDALAIRNSPRVDAENLPAIRYGIVSGAGNETTVVVPVASLLSLLEEIERHRAVYDCSRAPAEFVRQRDKAPARSAEVSG